MADEASSPYLAYLGGLKPGAGATARFSISSADNAAVTTYDLDSEVRYRDALDNSQRFRMIKVPVNVEAKPAPVALARLLPALFLIALIAGGTGYYLLVRRTKM